MNESFTCFKNNNNNQQARVTFLPVVNVSFFVVFFFCSSVFHSLKSQLTTVDSHDLNRNYDIVADLNQHARKIIEIFECENGGR